MNLAFLILLFLLQDSDPTSIAVRAGKIQTVSHGDVLSGTVYVRGEKIFKVTEGEESLKKIPLLEFGSDSVMVPGFIDAHSYLGSSLDVEEFTEAITPQVHALDAFSSQGEGIQDALKSGVTLVSIAPGPGNLISGRTGLLRLTGTRFDRMIFRNPYGMKVGLTNWVLRRDRKPTSASGALRLLRENLRGEVGQFIKENRIPVLLDASSARQIQVALSLKKEFELDAVLLHADSGARVVPEIKKSGMAVILSPLGISDSMEYLSTPAKFAEAGIRFAFASDSPLTGESYLRLSATLSMRYGLSREEALRSLTLSAAEILGVAQEVGSLEKGKLADLVVFDGDPLDLSSDVLLVMVGGKVVYQRDRE